jgi:NADH:ubiquinone oxidoreductase subunit K
MEGGYDVTHEKLKATLCAPILGCFGLAGFLGGHRPAVVPVILSFVIILGSTALMLFHCRSVRTFWTLTVVHIIIVAVSSIGFSQMTRYWNENP